MICERFITGASPGCRRKSRSAFTVLEVVVAATVMAFAIATSITALVQGIRALDNARSLTVASNILQDQLEDLRSTPWSTVGAWSLDAESTLTLNSVYTGNPLVTNHQFSCKRIVTSVAGKAALRKVSYTVTWRGSDGMMHSRLAVSYYCQSGLYDYVSQ